MCRQRAGILWVDLETVAHAFRKLCRVHADKVCHVPQLLVAQRLGQLLRQLPLNLPRHFADQVSDIAFIRHLVITGFADHANAAKHASLQLWIVKAIFEQRI